MKQLRVLDVVLSCAVLALVTLLLLPAVARVSRTKDDATCQSNLRRLAQAIDMYLKDNYYTYPINRKIVPLTGKLTTTTIAQVPLSPDYYNHGPYDLPVQRGVSGPNWVEALYPYLLSQGVKTAHNWCNFLHCPLSKPVFNQTAPHGGVSYALNYHLCNVWAALQRNPEKLMMFREMDYQSAASPVRPYTEISPTKATPGVFLNSTKDAYSPYPDSTPNLHGNNAVGGSYIALADGHVRWFSTDYYPEDNNVTYASCFDTETQQWFNYAKGNTTVPESMIRSIAITP